MASPEQAVSLLKTHLIPAPHTRVTQLISNLDDEEFQVREAASRDLTLLGEEAEPALRIAAKSGSLEVRRRAQKLLQRLQSHSNELSPDQLRGIRATQVLEQVGNQDAIQLLQQLSHGSPEARLTQEAKASIERLTQRAAMRN
jgi:HEAT repeat protein